MHNLGVNYYDFKSFAFKTLLNHLKIGVAAHVFASKFTSQNKIYQKLTTSSIAISQSIPIKLKTTILEKLL